MKQMSFMHSLILYYGVLGLAIGVVVLGASMLNPLLIVFGFLLGPLDVLLYWLLIRFALVKI